MQKTNVHYCSKVVLLTPLFSRNAVKTKTKISINQRIHKNMKRHNCFQHW